MASFASSTTTSGARKHAWTNISQMPNTPGTRGWSRLRDRTLAVQKKRVKIHQFLVQLCSRVPPVVADKAKLAFVFTYFFLFFFFLRLLLFTHFG